MSEHESWELTIETDGDNPEMYIESPGATIAEVCGGKYETRLKNGYLLAASPDLLACVEVWIEQMRQEMAPEDSAQFRMAKAAIAKARGSK